MKDKHCSFEFHKVGVEEVKQLLLFINKDKPPGTNNLDGKLLRLAAEYIVTPVCRIFNLSLEEGVCSQTWSGAKVIPLPKNSRAPFNGSNSLPISLLQVLSNILENIVFDQIQRYFTCNKLTTDIQHAYIIYECYLMLASY